MTTGADRPWVFDRDGEDALRLLLDAHDLDEGHRVHVVASRHADALTEAQSRLAAAGPLRPLEPGPPRTLGDRVVAAATELARADAGRPVVWVEAARYDPQVWDHAVHVLTQERDRLRAEAPALVVLAGPEPLVPLVESSSHLATTMSPPTVLRSVPRRAPSADRGPVRWLHLSDLHFKKSVRWERRLVLTSLIEHVTELAATGLAPDLVLVTGDIAFSGKVPEYDQAIAFFQALLEPLGLDPREHLFLVPGNHDVDRDAISIADRMLLEGLLRLPDDALQAAIEETLSQATDVLAARLAAFYDFTRRLLGPGRQWMPEHPWRIEEATVRGLTLGILQLNTAWASGPGDAKGRLLLGKAQLLDALAELAHPDVTLALTHHPPSWLAEPDEREIAGLLHSPRGVDFLLRGHTHDEDVVTLTGPSSRTTHLGAGATYVGGRWPKGCLLTELDPSAGTGTVHFLGHAERDGGFWHHDGSRYRGAPDGRWTFDLPEPLRARLAGTASATPAGAPAAERLDLLADRYRQQAIHCYQQIGFGVVVQGDKRSPNTSTTSLFTPLCFDDGSSTADLARALLARDDEGRAARVVVLGDPGSGKTTLTRYLAVWAAGGAEIEGVLRPQPLVPLVIPFRAYLGDVRDGQGADLLGFLERQGHDLLSSQFDAPFLRATLDAGRALVLFDGLDEVARPTERGEAVTRIRTFAARYPRCAVLATSRVVGYDDARLPQRDPATPDGFTHRRLQPLDDAALATLVARLHRALEPTDLREQQRLTADLQAQLAASGAAKELARNPLLATLICLVHRSQGTLPGRRARLYALVIEILLERWDQVRLGEAAMFDAIDSARQRRYLGQLALQLQEERASREDDGGATLLERPRLVEALARIARPDLGDEARRVVQAWVRWIEHRTGLLVELLPGMLGFPHLTLQEFLAAEALVRSGDQLAQRLVESLVQPSWWATVELALGLVADELARASELLRAVLEADASDRARATVLLGGLCEGMRAEASEVQSILSLSLDALPPQATEPFSDGVVTRLVRLARWPPVQGPDVRKALLSEMRSWTNDEAASPALLGALADLSPDAATLAEIVAHCARLTRDGERLYFLCSALAAGAERWPDDVAGLASTYARVFEHIPPPADSRFATATTRDGEVDLWRRVPAGTSLDEVACVPVTNGQFRAFCPRHRPEEPSHWPVTHVSWFAAMSFCRWLAAQVPGCDGARLPDAHEWRTACLAGATTGYWFGDDTVDIDRFAWHSQNRTGRHPQPAGVKEANPWGLYDVHGNVLEWTTTSRGRGRVVKGGSWRGPPSACQAPLLRWREPAARRPDLGFRVVRSMPGALAAAARRSVSWRRAFRMTRLALTRTRQPFGVPASAPVALPPECERVPQPPGDAVLAGPLTAPESPATLSDPTRRPSVVAPEAPPTAGPGGMSWRRHLEHAQAADRDGRGAEARRHLAVVSFLTGTSEQAAVRAFSQLARRLAGDGRGSMDPPELDAGWAIRDAVRALEQDRPGDALSTLQAAREPDDSPLRELLVHARADAALAAERLDEAAALYERARQAWRDLNDRRAESVAAAGLGIVALRAGDELRAERWFRLARALADDAGTEARWIDELSDLLMPPPELEVPVSAPPLTVATVESWVQSGLLPDELLQRARLRPDEGGAARLLLSLRALGAGPDTAAVLGLLPMESSS